jgi:hypothetical protein
MSSNIKARLQSQSDQAWKSAEELQSDLIALQTLLGSWHGKQCALTSRENDLARFALTLVIGEVSFRKASRDEQPAEQSSHA